MKLLRASQNGVISGIILTIFFKSVEYYTQHKVYTLLLNVDYIPFINQLKLTEIVEIALHLFVSIVISISLYITVNYLNINKIIPFYIGVCLFIGIIIFPTTALSTRTPSITSIPSLTYWLIGHILFGYILGFFHVVRLKERFSSKNY